MKISSEDLATTHAAAFGGTRAWTAQEFSNLRDQRGVILCGDAKSFILGRVIADEAEILTLATHPDFRRQGRAHQALRDFIAAAARNGGQRVFLEVATDNNPAKALYFSENFSQVGNRPGYYMSRDGAKTDAVILERRL